MVIAIVARPASLREPSLLRRMALIGLAASFAMLAMPVFHFHYFLPFAGLELPGANRLTLLGGRPTVRDGAVVER